LYNTFEKVARKYDIPRVIVHEAVWFYKSAKKLRTRPELRGKTIILSREKSILAIFYTLAKRLGYDEVADRIATMPCGGKNNTPCYASRRKSDKEFKKYLKVIRRYAALLYPATRDYERLIKDHYAKLKIILPRQVTDLAVEIAKRSTPVTSGKNPRLVAVACLYVAVQQKYPTFADVILSSSARLSLRPEAIKTLASQILNYLENSNNGDSRSDGDNGVYAPMQA
jgi:transcription initiation factor TFIIIB Brf1 subunit/transcription initiation factor TFIIB